MWDLIDYIKECWRITLNLRERRRQMWALIVAILALPLFWLVDGKLEPTQEGALYIAVWATASALFTLFVLAPFQMWRERRSAERAAATPSAEVWLHDAVFYVMHGHWPTDGQTVFPPLGSRQSSSEWEGELSASQRYPLVIHALAELRQAARDHLLRVRGRPNARGVLNVELEVVGDPLFDDVSRTHWVNHEIDPMMLTWRPEQLYTVEVGSTHLSGDSICSIRVLKNEVERVFAPGSPSRALIPEDKFRELRQLREEGVRLRNEQVPDVAALPSWTQRQEAWCAQIYEAAGRVSANLRGDIETLNAVGPPPVGAPPVSEQHRHAVAVISEILRRVEAYIRRFP